MSSKTILVCHQSADLYGSDRSLLEFLVAAPKNDYSFLVLVPESGPLTEEFSKHGLEFKVVPLLKISRGLFSPRGILGLPFALRESVAYIDAAVGDRKIVAVYSNTVAILGGAFWSMLRSKPHVWHVREIIRKPALVSVGLRLLVVMLSKRVVCNSRATYDWMTSLNKGSSSKASVVWNGVTSNPPSLAAEAPHDLRKSYAIPSDKCLVMVAGRINNWKGQDLLVDAINRLSSELVGDILVFFVGGTPPGQPEPLDNLKLKVAESSYSEKFRFVEFTNSISDYYRMSDLVVVPSREPEPFGRVAIEAMSFGVPVIAANHGGLSEIVEDGRSGYLFEPNSADSLAQALEKFLRSSSRDQMSASARERQRECFSLESYCDATMNVLTSVVQDDCKR